MKAFIVMIAVSAAVLSVCSITPTVFAANGWGLEDPQLCVNDQLLSVTAVGLHGGSVTVPKSATVSWEVDSCGGRTKLGVVPSEDVTFQGGNILRVVVYADDGTSVNFSFGDTSVTDVATNGSASAKFQTK